MKSFTSGSRYTKRVAWVVLIVLLGAGYVFGQRFVGAYGYAPYGGYLNTGRGRGNVLYGGAGWYVNSGQGYQAWRYRMRGYNEVLHRKIKRLPTPKPNRYELEAYYRIRDLDLYYFDPMNCDPFWSEPSGRQK